VSLPRFITGRYGKITAAHLNDTFEAVERVQNTPIGQKSMLPRGGTILARIRALTTDAVQGVAQDTDVGISGATARTCWMYDWEEVQFGVADFEPTPGVGSTFSHTGPDQVAGGTEGELENDTTYVPCIDFSPQPRLIAGDLVLLQPMQVRVGSKYVSMLACVLLEPTTFLARLTGYEAVEGVYRFVAVTAQISHILAASTLRPAVNLYEINALRSRSSSYANVLTMTEGGIITTFSGSDDWGHGQPLNEDNTANATVTKLPLPVGAAGTGTLVVMHRAVIEYDTGTPRGADTAYFCFYAVSPVEAECKGGE